jgi:uncharacterized Zn finger protein
MQDQRLNIDLSAAQDITCDNCGNYTFQEVALMKRLSALVSPTGKDAMIPIPTFACAACGFVNKQFLPSQITSEPTPDGPTPSPLTLVK